MVLETCQPLGIEASIQAMNGNRGEADQKRRMLELVVERARDEVDRARRQYDAVDPANRLVAAELEARWNGALIQASEADPRSLGYPRGQSPANPGEEVKRPSTPWPLPASRNRLTAFPCRWAQSKGLPGAHSRRFRIHPASCPLYLYRQFRLFQNSSGQLR
jgi:hypothetical protein